MYLKGFRNLCCRGGVQNSKEKIKLLKNLPTIQYFVDVFRESISSLLPKWDIDFTIELIQGAAPISRTLYSVGVPKLTDIKMQLQELLDKGYIHPSMSHWGA